MNMTYYFFSLVFLAIFILSVVGDSSDQCVYTVYVKTGSILKAGTDSKISATISNAKGKSVKISNLESWGLMGSRHDYFERGNVDIFTGRAQCINTPICKLNLTSDGSGSGHGWYCKYFEVTVTGAHTGCSQTLFNVNQWLATDTSPYKLSTVIDLCKDTNVGLGHGMGPFVARKKPIQSHDSE